MLNRINRLKQAIGNIKKPIRIIFNLDEETKLSDEELTELEKKEEVIYVYWEDEKESCSNIECSPKGGYID